jgi:hypothetical protein
MGLETAALVVAAVATVGKSAFEIKAANQRESAIDLQKKELELQTQQKTLQNYDLMEKVIDSQIAHQTTTGFAFSSPSFNAIERETLNIGARRQKNINIEDEIAKENLEIEKKNVQDSLYSQLFGNAVSAATSVAGVYAKAANQPGKNA